MTEAPITRLLPVRLTTDEIRQHGETMARMERLYEEWFAAIKLTAKEGKEKLAEKRGEILALAKSIETHQEWREVACQERANFERSIIEVIRTDTGEIVETRAMTITERQMGMWDDTADVHATMRPPRKE